MGSVSKKLNEILGIHKQKVYKSFKLDGEDFSYIFIFSEWQQTKAFMDDINALDSDYLSIMRNNVYSRIDLKRSISSEEYQEMINLRRLLMENLTYVDITKGKRKTKSIWQITGEETVKTLGFLAKNAHIRADIPYPKQDIFDSQFFNIKHRYPNDDENGYSPHRCARTRFYCLRITFRSPDVKLLFPPDVKLKKEGKNSIRISSNEWGWELIEKGFGLGIDHDIEEIESWVPSQHKEAFQEGINIGG